VKIWKRRSLLSGAALLATCGAIAQFLVGHWLHDYWDSFGKYLIPLALGLMIVCLYCTLLLVGAWSSLRELRTEANRTPG